ncbi:MAG TPA: ATP phosphoribosyltransferase regulatory subunit [Ectothiorhodospiraceae bacterium]|nr:ATP phosphoribosyltransferase regulatory subunit [Ectothiorhodospiraceae bacterium]
MSNDTKWILPEGIEELSPQRAAQVEQARRQLLDLYRLWGYEMVMPPFVEYLDSLLTGTGEDLELKTFKLIDQMTGRMMGVRADMTPQVARIDAHLLKREQPTRLCYVGTVLQTLPDSHGGTRSPLQVGAELYGHAGVESDLEIVRLAVESLQQLGLKELTLDIGHVGIYRALIEQAGLSQQQQQQLFELMQRKSLHEISALFDEWDFSGDIATMLKNLVGLAGDQSTLSRASELLKGATPEVHEALETLQKIAARLGSIDGIHLHFDLTELRGYHYHTGLVFAAYVLGESEAVVHGGRYDEIGKVFGRARPATGFTLELKRVLTLAGRTADVESDTILAPADDDAQLIDKIAALRAAGQRVIQELPGQGGDVMVMGCSHILEKGADGWQVVALAQ